MNTYVGFYKEQEPKTCQADTQYHAQLALAKLFKAKKAYEVAVILAEKEGVPVIHNPAILD